MPHPDSDRPALLVVQAATEPFVLAKLVQALRPHRILLFASSRARAKGWDLALCERYTADHVIDGFEVAELPELSVNPPPEGEQGTIESAVRRAVGSVATATAETTIIVDTTRGLGLARIQIYEAVRRVVTDGYRLAIAYCDADRGQVLISSIMPPAPLKAIDVRFALDGHALDRRLAIYGLYATVGDDRVADKDALLAVFEAMCSSPAVRALFHSGQALRVTWKILEKARRLPPDTLARLLEFIAQRASSGLAYELGAERVDIELARRTVWQYLCACVAGANDNLAWCRTYLSNPAPGYWTQALRGLEDATRLTTTLPPKVVGSAKGEAVRTRDAALVRMRKFVVGCLTDELATLFAEPSDGPQMNATEDRQFVADQLHSAGSPPVVQKTLLETKGRLPGLFEQCLSAVVNETVQQCNAADRVQVHENVIVLRPPRGATIAEFDTLLLHASGDMLVLEAKTHHSSAGHKDMESRIKQLRDLGGAYNQFYLVFPLVRADLDALAAGNAPPALAGGSSSLADTDLWVEFMRRVGASRDQRILGIDEISKTIAADLQRLNGRSTRQD